MSLSWYANQPEGKIFFRKKNASSEALMLEEQFTLFSICGTQLSTL